MRRASTARLLGGHAGAEIVVDGEIEMSAEFGVEVVVIATEKV